MLAQPERVRATSTALVMDVMVNLFMEMLLGKLK
jgi:hypothetical protein